MISTRMIKLNAILLEALQFVFVSLVCGGGGYNWPETFLGIVLHHKDHFKRNMIRLVPFLRCNFLKISAGKKLAKWQHLWWLLVLNSCDFAKKISLAEFFGTWHNHISPLVFTTERNVSHKHWRATQDWTHKRIIEMSCWQTSGSSKVCTNACKDGLDGLQRPSKRSRKFCSIAHFWRPLYFQSEMQKVCKKSQYYRQ